jgi:hypothetical protein
MLRAIVQVLQDRVKELKNARAATRGRR